MTDLSNDQRLATLKRRLNTELVEGTATRPTPTTSMQSSLLPPTTWLTLRSKTSFRSSSSTRLSTSYVERGLHRELHDETAASDNSGGDQ